MPDRLLLIVLANVAESDIASFQSYESEVLPMLARHGGRLERRLRSGDGTFEAHVVSFAGEDHYRAFVDDPARVESRRRLEGRDVRQRVVVVGDVRVSSPSRWDEVVDALVVDRPGRP